MEVPPLDVARAYGRDAARNVEAIAAKLEALAERLRAVAPRLERVDGTAANTAADVVDGLTQGVGNLGRHTRLLVTNAGKADVYAAAAAAELVSDG